jgi:hypothetical protein
MRCVAMQFSGVGTRAFTPDRDALLQFIQVTAGGAVVSDNPSLLQADLQNPGSAMDRHDVLVWVGAGGTMGQILGASELKIPLAKDRAIFVAASTSSTVFLYLDDVEPS